ncbi:putative ubiquitin carboxyl-terminal hydrolase [Xylariaceae sp. FL0804]|nr:putative ubiquitin carboxyl-terminal hydrolase [Xylariaceae sp. FL0804]
MSEATTTNPDPPASSAAAFVPLEANPELMTALLRRLGLSPALAVHDVYSLTEPELLGFVPRPALALLLVFPVSAAYESARLAEDAALPAYTGTYTSSTSTSTSTSNSTSNSTDDPTSTGGEGDGKVMWWRQTIRNACGLMGLLHAVSNGPARSHIAPDTPLARLLAASAPLPPDQRAKLLESSPDLAAAHAEAAAGGDTAAPDARDDVDLHYVCFVRTDDNDDASTTEGSGGGSSGGSGSGTLWELDGRRKGPLNRGRLAPGEDVLSDRALLAGPLKFLERGGGDMRFSCVALAGALD